jgi:hypothetical protein
MVGILKHLQCGVTPSVTNIGIIKAEVEVLL